MHIRIIEPFSLDAPNELISAFRHEGREQADRDVGEEVLSCTILTCGPNRAIGELHDRMLAILSENDWPKWLGEEAVGVKVVGCRILRNFLKNFRACLNAASTAMAGYF